MAVSAETFGSDGWMASPAHLAVADTGGKWRMPPHIKYINTILAEEAYRDEAERLADPLRLILNVAYRHGKSWETSHYYPAWRLLREPHTRIMLVASEDSLAASFGVKVKTTIERFGKKAGVRLRKDTRAKAEWLIDSHGGGMFCRGPESGLIGRDADLFIIDDLIKNPVQAMSAAILERHWEFYKTVVYGRLQSHSGVILVGTRWCKGDLFGRVLSQARRTGEKWQHIKFKAIAEEDDPLGRKPGEALWPEKVSLKQLQVPQKEWGRWFRAAWQQEPEDEEGALLKPRLWPRYSDIGGAYSIPRPAAEGGGRLIHLHQDIVRFSTVDWAWSEKATSDCSAIATWGLTPLGKLLLLDLVADRIPLHGLAPAIAGVCKRLHPHMVAVETGHPTLSNDCRRFQEIPELRWLKTQGKTKLQRALPAIVMGENGMILLPDSNPDWLEGYLEQVLGFTGSDERDDLVDVTSYAAQMAQELKGGLGRPRGTESWPELLIAGKEVW